MWIRRCLLKQRSFHRMSRQMVLLLCESVDALSNKGLFTGWAGKWLFSCVNLLMSSQTKIFSQDNQANGFSPVWIFRCTLNRKSFHCMSKQMDFLLCESFADNVYSLELAPNETELHACIQTFSLLFLSRWSPSGKTFSIGNAFMSVMSWPLLLKCSPMGWSRTFLET